MSSLWEEILDGCQNLKKDDEEKVLQCPKLCEDKFLWLNEYVSKIKGHFIAVKDICDDFRTCTLLAPQQDG